MTNSDSSTLTQEVVDLLEADVSLGLKAVYYGDQAAIPFFPSVTVEAGTKDRRYNQTGLQYSVEVPIYIMLYHGKAIDISVLRKEADELAEAVQSRLLLYRKLNFSGTDLVTSSLVTSLEPGFGTRNNVQLFVHRLTLECMIREQAVLV
jgi:hypothetical protein